MAPQSSTGCPPLEQLEQFVSGELHDTKVDEHLTCCEECRGRTRQIRKNNDLLGGFVSAARQPRGGGFTLPKSLEVEGYELVREIRRGGQGVVYKAVHKKTKREVALKMLLAGRAASERKRQRFEREIELVASLRHPNIVTLYDSGQTSEGGHFFAMEYVDGVPLDKYVETSKRPNVQTSKRDLSLISDLLALFVKVCDAVQHAHRHGVIHRDLKPGNILVDSAGEPHVLDFGVARALGRDALSGMMNTKTGEFMGTFAYAAPEQVSGDPDQVDTRSDVYALGVILYEVLTGVSPYANDGPLSDVIRNITHVDPLQPSTHSRTINHELDVIVLKSLAKERERRYQSVEALRLDIERFLAGDPIDAKRDSTWYVFKKMARRYRGAVTVASIFVFLITGFAIFMLFSAHRERDNASRLAKTVNDLRIERGRASLVSGDAAFGEEAIWEAHLKPPPNWELESAATAQAAGSLLGKRMELVGDAGPFRSYWALWETYSRTNCLTTWGLDSNMTCGSALSPNGSTLAMGQPDGTIDVWDLFEQRVVQVIRTHDSCTQPVLFSNGILGATHPDGDIELIRIADRATLGWLQGHVGKVRYMTANEDGALLVTSGDDRTVRLWDVATQSELTRLDDDAVDVQYLRFSPRGRWVGVMYKDRIKLWDLATLRLEREVFGPNLGGRTFAFAPDESSLAAAFSNMVMDKNLVTDTSRSYLLGGLLNTVKFSNDGRWLACTGVDGALRLVDRETRRVERTFAAYRRFGANLSFLEEDRSLFTVYADGTCRVFETAPRPHLRRLGDVNRSILSLGYSPDGNLIAAAGGDRFRDKTTWLIEIRHAQSGELLRTLGEHESTVCSIAFNQSSDKIVSGSYDGSVRLWDVANGECLGTFVHNDQKKVSGVAFHPNGGLVASGSFDGAVRLWDVDTANLAAVFREHHERTPQVHFSPDGSRLASCGMDGRVVIYDVESRKTGMMLQEHGAAVRCLAFTPDGRYLASGGDDSTIRIWDLQTGRKHMEWEAHGHDIFWLAFHRDGRLLASGGRGPDIKLWDAASAQCLLTLEGHDAEVFALAFSTDGKTLASGGADQSLALWDLTYYNRHIAGNLEHQIRRLGTESDAATVERMRRWASTLPNHEETVP